jgi:hypothetical protein
MDLKSVENDVTRFAIYVQHKEDFIRVISIFRSVLQMQARWNDEIGLELSTTFTVQSVEPLIFELASVVAPNTKCC